MSLLDRVLGKNRDKDVPDGQPVKLGPSTPEPKPQPPPKPHAGTGQTCVSCGYWWGSCGAGFWPPGKQPTAFDPACSKFWNKLGRGSPVEMGDIR